MTDTWICPGCGDCRVPTGTLCLYCLSIPYAQPGGGSGAPRDTRPAPTTRPGSDNGLPASARGAD